MLGKFKRFISDTQGNVALAVGVAAVPILATAGIAVDYTILNQKSHDLQVAADSAALSSVRELGLANTTDNAVVHIAENYVESNLPARGGRQVKVDVAISANRKQIAVELSETWKPIFLQFFKPSVMPITVTAEAALAGKESLCVIALDRSFNSALNIAGKATMQASGCAIYSNSDTEKGIGIVSGAKMMATSTFSAGGYSGPISGFSPEPIVDSIHIDDPLGGRPQPVSGTCDYNSLSISSTLQTLSPGTFCGGLKIYGKAGVNLKPGTYIMKDGPLIVSGDATLSGENVGFAFEGTKSTFDFGVSTQINITAQTSGPMSGILFFENRAAPLNRQFTIRSKDAERFEGTIYLPRGKLFIDKASRLGQKSKWTAIIANRIKIGHGPNLQINSDYANSSIPVPEGIGTSSAPAKLIR